MNNLGNILKERDELIEAEQLLFKAVSIQYVANHIEIHNSLDRQPFHFTNFSTKYLPSDCAVFFFSFCVFIKSVQA